MDEPTKSSPGAGPRTATAAERAAEKPGWFNSVAFLFLWAGLWVFLRLWCRMRVENRPKLRGAFVLAPNHGSFLDPVIIGTAMHRRIAILMTETIWRSPLMGWFYRWNSSIPVSSRAANRDALRAARSVLQQGRILGIFPEGGICRDGGLMLGSPGAVSLVLNEGVPIVPVGIIGAYDAMPPGKALPRPRKIIVRFGNPITPEELAAKAPGDRKGNLQHATRLIMERIAELTGGTARETELERAKAGATQPSR
jgi:1-acyl-sn-glycerol-3-phosphate acyltransferase